MTSYMIFSRLQVPLVNYQEAGPMSDADTLVVCVSLFSCPRMTIWVTLLFPLSSYSVHNWNMTSTMIHSLENGPQSFIYSVSKHWLCMNVGESSPVDMEEESQDYQMRPSLGLGICQSNLAVQLLYFKCFECIGVSLSSYSVMIFEITWLNLIIASKQISCQFSLALTQEAYVLAGWSTSRTMVLSPSGTYYVTLRSQASPNHVPEPH